MANYTVFGFIKDKNCNPIVNANVYVYFKKIDSGSPDSKWSDVPYTTDNLGYYSFNLGDNVLLGSEAGFKKGTDKIYIAVTYGGDKLLTSTNLTHALFYAHTTITEDLFELNLDIEEKRSPVFNSFNFPSNGLTQHQYTMSETSYADTSWIAGDCYNTVVSQKSIYDNVDIFTSHVLTDTIYDWGEVEPLSVSNNSYNNYTFTDAGVYNLSITINELWNTSTTVNQTVTIKYNEPIVNFNWTPTNTSEGILKGQELITFNNLTSDLDNRSNLYTYEWIIEDDVTQIINANLNDSPQYVFLSPGVKNITLKCYYNDGFDDLVSYITKQITIHEFDIDANFSFNNPKGYDEIVNFSNNTIDIDNKVQSYNLLINDYYDIHNPNNPTYGVSTTDNTQDLLDIDIDLITHNFQSKTNHEIVMTVFYDNGWELKSKTITKYLNPDEYELIINIDTDVTPVNNGFVGKNEINYFGVYTGNASNRVLSASWSWDDVDLSNISHVTSRINQEPSLLQPFTYNYPSRMPFSADNYNGSYNVNKLVILEVTYDNGWTDINKKDISEYYEASPYEIQTDISVQENITGYTH